MSRPDLSPAVAKIVHRLDAMREIVDKAITEYRTSAESEAALNAAYELAFARAYLTAEGPVKARECRAKIDTIRTYEALQNAIALRRSAKGALDALGKDVDCLTAALHAHNREIRVLGG